MQSIFEAALSISSPWFISEMSFNEELKRLDIHIDFETGTHFPIEVNGEEYPVYDTREKMWRHLNFFEHECYLHCRVPRVYTGSGYKLVSPPWSGRSNGFSLLFEAFLIQLCAHMPIAAVSRLVKVTDKKIWSMLEKYIDQTRELEEFSSTTAIGIDETSRAKRHQYITLFVDLDQRRTLYITEGKDNLTVNDFVDDFTAHSGDIDAIKDVSSDMSPAFIKGVTENLPNAEITFDKFHIVKLINEALDAVRRREVKENPILRKCKYTLMTSEANRTTTHRKKLRELSKEKMNLATYRALEIRDAFTDIYKIDDEKIFVTRLQEWYSWALRSRIPEMVDVARTIKKHWKGIIRWRISGLSNGILEGLNSLIQAAKAKARGYRSIKNFKIIAYLVTGKLEFEKINPMLRG